MAGIHRPFGRFLLVRQIGSGGSGVVFEAHDPVLKRSVALKLLRGRGEISEDLLARFRREIQALARVQHPNVVAIYEAGLHHTTHYLAMELVSGTTLASHFLDGTPLAIVLEWIEQAARGIHAAQEEGILHRDVKPANILVDETRRVRVIDFGIAKLEHASAPDLTKSDMMLGTPAYMAPELALGRKDDFGRATDVYALGATLFEALTGEILYPAAWSPVDLMEELESTRPTPRARDRKPSVPPALDEICARATAKKPADRYQTPSAFADALAAARGVAPPVVAVAPPTPAAPPPAPPRPEVTLGSTDSANALPALLGSSEETSPTPVPRSTSANAAPDGRRLGVLLGVLAGLVAVSLSIAAGIEVAVMTRPDPPPRTVKVTDPSVAAAAALALGAPDLALVRLDSVAPSTSRTLLRAAALLDLGRPSEAKAELAHLPSPGGSEVEILRLTADLAAGEPRLAAERVPALQGAALPLEALVACLEALEAGGASAPELLAFSERAPGDASTRALVEARALTALGRAREARLLLDGHLLIEPGFDAGRLERARLAAIQGDTAVALDDVAAIASRSGPLERAGAERVRSVAIRAQRGNPAEVRASFAQATALAARAGRTGRHLARDLQIELSIFEANAALASRDPSLARAAHGQAVSLGAPPRVRELLDAGLRLAESAQKAPLDAPAIRAAIEALSAPRADGEPLRPLLLAHLNRVLLENRERGPSYDDVARLYDAAEQAELQDPDGAIREELTNARAFVRAAELARGHRRLAAEGQAIASRLVGLRPFGLRPRRALARAALAGGAPGALALAEDCYRARPAGDLEMLVAILARGGDPSDLDALPYLRARVESTPNDGLARAALGELLERAGFESEVLDKVVTMASILALPPEQRRQLLEIRIRAADRRVSPEAVTLRARLPQLTRPLRIVQRPAWGPLLEHFAPKSRLLGYRGAAEMCTMTSSPEPRAIAYLSTATPATRAALTVEHAHRDDQALPALIASLDTLAAPRSGCTAHDIQAVRTWRDLWAAARTRDREALAAVASAAARLGEEPAARLLAAVARRARNEPRGQVELDLATRLCADPGSAHVQAARLLVALGRTEAARSEVAAALSLPFPYGAEAAAALTTDARALARPELLQVARDAPVVFERFDSVLADPWTNVVAGIGLARKPLAPLAIGEAGEASATTIALWVRRDPNDGGLRLGAATYAFDDLEPGRWQLAVLRIGVGAELRVDGRARLWFPRPTGPVTFPLELLPGASYDDVRIYHRLLDDREVELLEAAASGGAGAALLNDPLGEPETRSPP